MLKLATLDIQKLMMVISFMEGRDSKNLGKHSIDALLSSMGNRLVITCLHKPQKGNLK